MPRNKKGAKKRKTSGERWRRNRERKSQFQTLGADGPIHKRIEIDALEFACLFLLEGGAEAIGSEDYSVRDANGKIPGDPISPRILGVDRGKIGLWMQRWEDASFIADARERVRENRKQIRLDKLLDAAERGSYTWHRHEVPDQKLRSILAGSNGGKDPTQVSEKLVICYKDDDGRYHVAEETWDGSWSVDSDNRERVGVEIDPLPITFHDEKEAQRAITFALKAGELERFADQKDDTHFSRIAKRLRVWNHKDTNRKKIYG